MITASRIQYLVNQGEGYKVDFKSAVPAKVRELSEEVCSFANAHGGYIFIGVDDKGNIVGCNISNSKPAEPICLSKPDLMAFAQMPSGVIGLLV